jgi:hypothetical protein
VIHTEGGVFVIKEQGEEKQQAVDFIAMTERTNDGVDPDVGQALHQLFDDVEDLREVLIHTPGCDFAYVDDMGQLVGLNPDILRELEAALDELDKLAMRRRVATEAVEEQEVVVAEPESMGFGTWRDESSLEVSGAEPAPNLAPAAVSPDILRRWKSRTGPLDPVSVADARRDHAEAVAEKLREAERQSDEVYAAKIVEDGRARVAERRETLQVADTDVVGGQVIKKNADGAVIGATQRAD